MNSAAHDLAAEIPVVRAAILNTAATAAGSGDSTTITGASIDLTSLGARFNSAALMVGSSATMASGESLAVKYILQYSSNDSDWTGVATVATLYTHTATGGAATAAARGGVVNMDLTKAGRYIRATVTPDLSRAGTDTAVVAAVWAFGGADRIPVAA